MKTYKCKECGITTKNYESHYAHQQQHDKYKLANKLMDKGYPEHTKEYKYAHEKAVKAEKRKYGKTQFKKMSKVDSKLSKHELAGKNLKSGKIEVSKKVPKKFRGEVAYHEKVESKILRKNK